MSDMKKFEETEDCFILDFDPSDAMDLTKLSLSKNTDSKEPEIAIIAEKGQVACRDYPHPRHLCLKYPFDTTLHRDHCDLCYCFVCDVVAPCKEWDYSIDRHCDAKDDYAWRSKRNLKRPEERREGYFDEYVL
ncbi:RPM1 interacting protein 13-like protein [Drosera capensis]